ncbi:MAG TPA: type I-B CRISPR-associated protein Cas5b [Candidatus Nitrosotenuis sp.]|nr:type I-B CRISPR-associated protein Cas5b [Candidatus Nitrosotenuis sp.]
MKVVRVHIIGWTASFRHPTFISGYQPTLPVPPLSTIYGLLSAAKGELVTPEESIVGYVFQSKGKALDLETIYELEKLLKAKSNVVTREILIEPELFLYLPDMAFKRYFRQPYYPLLLGRSTELVMVKEIKEVELEKKANVRIGGSILPFDPALQIAGKLQALPTHFSDSIPRYAKGTQPFYLLETDFTGKTINYRPQIYEQEIDYDKEKDWGVYFHGGGISKKSAADNLETAHKRLPKGF